MILSILRLEFLLSLVCPFLILWTFPVLLYNYGKVYKGKERLKDDPVKYEAYNLKDKKRKQRTRNKEKEIPVDSLDAARKRKLNRERIRRYRCRKKAEEREKMIPNCTSKLFSPHQWRTVCENYYAVEYETKFYIG